MRQKILLVAALAAALCSTAAEAAEVPERCRLEPVNGSCKALIERFYFDVGGKKCKPYFYDGCGPVVPFETEEECRTLCETGAELRMTLLRRVENRPYARVELEYPKDWTDRPAFTALVNGREAIARVTAGGFSPDVNMATLEVYVGPAPVTELAVTAEVGGRSYRVSSPLHWSLPAMLLLLDRAGADEALLEPGELRFFTYRAGAPKIRVNGAEVAAESVAGTAGGSSLWRVAPAWAPGRNSVTAEVTGSDGKPLAREYSFFNLAKGELPYRQKVVLAFGEPGSRSGPFYRMEAVGDAVALGAGGERTVDTVDTEGWLTQRQQLVREIVGAAPGEAVLRFYEKPHFLQPEALQREFRVKVPRAGGGSGKP